VFAYAKDFSATLSPYRRGRRYASRENDGRARRWVRDAWNDRVGDGGMLLIKIFRFYNKCWGERTFQHFCRMINEFVVLCKNNKKRLKKITLC
jgi:hypothetical protein